MTGLLSSQTPDFGKLAQELSGAIQPRLDRFRRTAGDGGDLGVDGLKRIVKP